MLVRKCDKTGGGNMIKRLLKRIHMHFESKKNWKMKMNVPLTIRIKGGA